MTFQIDYRNLHLTSVLTSTFAHPMVNSPISSQKDTWNPTSYHIISLLTTYPQANSEKKKNFHNGLRSLRDLVFNHLSNIMSYISPLSY